MRNFKSDVNLTDTHIGLPLFVWRPNLTLLMFRLGIHKIVHAHRGVLKLKLARLHPIRVRASYRPVGLAL
jgi:hypothetical protein